MPILEDIPRWSKLLFAITIYYNSQFAIGRAYNNIYNGKSGHIHCSYNTIRQLLSSGIIAIDYVRSKNNISDPLTKGLHREIVDLASKGMSLKSLKEKCIVNKMQPS